MILVDTNVISETLKPAPDQQVVEWLIAHDTELALPSIVVAELAYGIARIRPDQRAERLERGLQSWRARFRDRIHAFSEEDALAYGRLMGERSLSGHPMSIPDGMIAAMARTRAASVATRNVEDFRGLQVELVNPWAF